MTPEQGALLSKAHDRVRAAKLLSDAGLYDFAVSRADYAMFPAHRPGLMITEVREQRLYV